MMKAPGAAFQLSPSHLFPAIPLKRMLRRTGASFQSAFALVLPLLTPHPKILPELQLLLKLWQQLEVSLQQADGLPQDLKLQRQLWQRHPRLLFPAAKPSPSPPSFPQSFHIAQVFLAKHAPCPPTLSFHIAP